MWIRFTIENCTFVKFNLPGKTTPAYYFDLRKLINRDNPYNDFFLFGLVEHYHKI